MIDLSMTTEEAKENSGLCSPGKPGDGPKYPYGLSLSLNDDVMAKLKMGLPEVRTTVLVQALATVTSVRSSQQMDGDKESGCELQITDMEITTQGGKSDAQLAASMYGKGE